MKMNKKRTCTRNAFTTLPILFTLALGCGGGRGSNDPPPQPPAAGTISGVAAAGAPIIGTVTLKDSSDPAQERTAAIEADGGYSIDVTGLTPPFALRANGEVGGRSYQLYSAGLASDIDGTINITPFTDLILANMAGQIAANYYDSGAFAGMTEEELAAAQEALRSQLLPILTGLGVSSSIDLLRTSFDADHTGLDAVIDVVRVTVDPATVRATLTNVVNQETINVDITSGTYAGTFSDAGLSPEVVADLQGIAQMWHSFAAFYSSGLPDPDNLQFLDLFDEQEFLNDGETLAEMLTDLTTDSSMIGISITGIAIESIDKVDTDNGAALVAFAVMRDGRVEHSGHGSRMIERGGTWRWAGNGRIVGVDVDARMEYWSSTNRILSGLDLDIDAGLGTPPGIRYAVVTGPGLPADGLYLERQLEGDDFVIGITGGNYFTTLDGLDESTLTDNAVYTFELRDADNNIIASYAKTLDKAPLRLDDLSSDLFPAITAPSVDALSQFNGGTLTIAWTLPQGLESRRVGATIGATMTFLHVSAKVGPTQVSETLVLDAPAGFQASWREVSVNADDADGLIYSTFLW